MKTRIIIGYILLFPAYMFGQSLLTLNECQQLAQENYPLIKQYSLIDKSKEYTLSNIEKSYLPQVSLKGQASFQSAVTTMPTDFKTLGIPIDIKAPNEDQYKASLDVSQLIWDGGNINVQKNLVKAKSDIDTKQIEISLYQIKQRVNQLFFGILAIDAQLKQLDYLKDDLDTNKKMIISMFNNQMVTQSEIDLIDVQLLNVDQNKTELQSNKKAFQVMLSLFINKEINTDTKLNMPQEQEINIGFINRPEQALYNTQRVFYETQKKSIKAKNMPQLGLFLQGGYGNPALNMLENKFKLYGIGGIKLTWNFGNLYTKGNEKRNIEIQKQGIDVQEETFLFNTNFEMKKEYEDIQKTKELLIKDDEIIILRERIKKASESKYKNGVYTANDLIQDINAANKAMQTKELREIEYLQNIYNYQYTQGQ